MQPADEGYRLVQVTTISYDQTDVRGRLTRLPLMQIFDQKQKDLC